MAAATGAEEADPPVPKGRVRIRLVFENRKLLTRTQRAEGLHRCWMLVWRQVTRTVADVAAEVSRRFRLSRSCPDGLVFSMENFVLPPSESTWFFRENDIISVKKKLPMKIAKLNFTSCIEEGAMVLKDTISRDNILPFQYQEEMNMSEEEEARQHYQNTNPVGSQIIEFTSTKRRQDDVASRKRKRKPVTCEKLASATKMGGNGHKKHENSQLDGSPQRNVQINGSSSEGGVLAPSVPCTSDTLKEKINLEHHAKETSDSVPTLERRNPTELNGEAKRIKLTDKDASTKVPSRSARRKKAKRQLHREAKCQLNMNVESQAVPNGSHCTSFDQQATGQEKDEIDTSVPVVVRPGHIRFVSPGEDIPVDVQTCPPPQENSFWKRITSKKQGQKWKWGTGSINGTNDDDDDDAATSNWDNHVIAANCGSNEEQNNQNMHHESCGEKSLAEEGQSTNDRIDFESLLPLVDLPKEGDLVAYRVVELTPSFCPELSPYRVGKVTAYDIASKRVTLFPVPGYPVFPQGRNGEDELDELSVISLYREDGSLEIDYTSLIDVRLMKNSDSVSTAVSSLNGSAENPELDVAGTASGSSLNNCKALTSDSGYGNTHGNTTPNINHQQVQNGRIDQRTQNKVVATTTKAAAGKSRASPWSYSAMRRGAIGPTIAYLREKNAITGNSVNTQDAT